LTKPARRFLRGELSSFEFVQDLPPLARRGILVASPSQPRLDIQASQTFFDFGQPLLNLLSNPLVQICAEEIVAGGRGAITDAAVPCRFERFIQTSSHCRVRQSKLTFHLLHVPANTQKHFEK
jgi:hypothetical protein